MAAHVSGCYEKIAVLKSSCSEKLIFKKKKKKKKKASLIDNLNWKGYS